MMEDVSLQRVLSEPLDGCIGANGGFVSYFEGARSEIFPVAVDQSKEGTVNL
jgi:hypothetical protein